MKLFSFFLDDVSITFDYIPFFFVNNFQTIDILLGFCNRFLFFYFPVGYKHFDFIHEFFWFRSILYSMQKYCNVHVVCWKKKMHPLIRRKKNEKIHQRRRENCNETFFNHMQLFEFSRKERLVAALGLRHKPCFFFSKPRIYIPFFISKKNSRHKRAIITLLHLENIYLFLHKIDWKSWNLQKKMEKIIDFFFFFVKLPFPSLQRKNVWFFAKVKLKIFYQQSKIIQFLHIYTHG